MGRDERVFGFGIFGPQPFQQRVFFLWFGYFGVGFGIFYACVDVELSSSFFVVEDVVGVEDELVGVLVNRGIPCCQGSCLGGVVW